MREVIAVCRSSKRSRVRVAAVLDCYFWRIGDRTWRGRASNACLGRVSRELRAEAKRNTAVVIHEIRSARESRVPIVRIGSQTAFSPEGVVPIATHAARSGRRQPRSEGERARLAIVQIAALFHDLGKATELFQSKLRRGLKKNSKPEADAARHELVSAVVWDELVGPLDDPTLVERLRDLTPGDIDKACGTAVERVRRLHGKPYKPMELSFAERNASPVGREGTIAHAVGMLILTHHRLTEGSADHLRLLAASHVNTDVALKADDLNIAKGTPFWHDKQWIARLSRVAGGLRPSSSVPGLDMALRASLMFADHLGSALSEKREEVKGHLGNTRDGKPADPLDVHVFKVSERVLGCFDMLHRHRDRYPALGEDKVPIEIVHPEPAPEPFAWQNIAARAARQLCESREGGFFACLMAGTGTGKTRGAPSVLAGAAFGDARPERRYLRMTLALGLRSLASQSANDYVCALHFDPDDVSVLIGQPPVQFKEEVDDEGRNDGSQSLITLPDWLRVERATGSVPIEGSEREADWLRRLSCDTDRGLPDTLDRILENAGTRSSQARLLASAPILVGTIDHLMGVASPTSSRFLFQTLRVLSADLILDEIDQYEPEDIAAIGRLVYQTAAGGRRVIIMSATLTATVAGALHRAYREGWREYAAASGIDDHVNILCSGDAVASCVTSAEGAGFEQLYDATRRATLSALQGRSPQRRGRMLPPCTAWADLVRQVDEQSSRLHDATAGLIGGVKVSIGFVRMTRIAHTAALAVQLPAGPRDGRLRLKLCLHSQFPRLHREWIERELKHALTRNGDDPDAGLKRLCAHHRLIERVREQGCDQLEIVVVTSPVIETGNDLDFDWAIIDPSAMRTVAQAAGRVWRHRRYRGETPNVAILGRSAIVMATGKLARPGVETACHEDTLVTRISLDAFGERLVTELVGRETFTRIDASAILGDGQVPLREKEQELLGRMLGTVGDNDPLGCYIKHATVRLNLRMTRSRKFRRSDTRDIHYFQDIQGQDDWHWFVDLAPGTRDSAARLAEKHGLTIGDQGEPNLAFPNLDAHAWASMLGASDAETASERRHLMRVQVPDYGAEPEPAMTYHEWTGFTRGQPEDLFGLFGKAQKKQDDV